MKWEQRRVVIHLGALGIAAELSRYERDDILLVYSAMKMDAGSDLIRTLRVMSAVCSLHQPAIKCFPL